MNKLAIGILDSGYEGLTLFEELVREYRYETFIYINDIHNLPYEGQTVEAINKAVQKNIDILRSQGIKMLVVVSDLIVEHCQELLNSLEIPVINVVSAIIEYVNNNFEQKDLILLIKQEVIKANLYQKNFRYNHLFSINSTELTKIILNKQIKTSNSFFASKEVFKNHYRRKVDLLIISESYLLKLKTEIDEYLDVLEVISLLDVFQVQIDRLDEILEKKGKRKTMIISDLGKKEFYQQAYWLAGKYVYCQKNKMLIPNFSEQKNKDYNSKVNDDE